MILFLRLVGVFFSALLGGCLGSFLNVAVWRLPAGLSLVRPGSFCPKCGHAIRFRDNIPIFGWLILRGKCRDCGQPISPRYIIIETVVALIAAGTASLFFIGERSVPAGLLHWEGLAPDFSSISEYLSGQVFFPAVTPEELLVKGIAVTFCWTICLAFFLGLGLIQWDGHRLSPLVCGIQLVLPFLLLGKFGLIPVLGGIVFHFTARFAAVRFQRMSSLCLFFLFAAAFAGLLFFSPEDPFLFLGYWTVQ